MIIIGLSGVAGAGKDYFASLAVNYFRKRELNVKRFALADEVKIQLDPFIQDHFGFSCFTADRELKEQIRPMMVCFAETKKIHQGQDYWVNQLKYNLKNFLHIDIAIITDIRFPIELNWLKSVGGSLIHIDKYTLYSGLFPELYKDWNWEHRVSIQPKNEDERQNDPIMKNNADIKFSWPDLTEIEAQCEVEKFLVEGERIWNKPCLNF